MAFKLFIAVAKFYLRVTDQPHAFRVVSKSVVIVRHTPVFLPVSFLRRFSILLRYPWIPASLVNTHSLKLCSRLLFCLCSITRKLLKCSPFSAFQSVSSYTVIFLNLWRELCLLHPVYADGAVKYTRTLYFGTHDSISQQTGDNFLVYCGSIITAHSKR